MDEFGRVRMSSDGLCIFQKFGRDAISVVKQMVFEVSDEFGFQDFGRVQRSSDEFRWV